MTTVRTFTAYVFLLIVWLTSVASLASNLGLYGLDPNSTFAKVSLMSVIVEIVAAVVYFYRQSSASQSTGLSAVIEFPANIDQARLANIRWDRAKCVYELKDEEAKIKGGEKVNLVLGKGGWEFRIPSLTKLNCSIALRLVEDVGIVWEIPEFYPLTRTVLARQMPMKEHMEATDDTFPPVQPGLAAELPFRQVRIENMARLVRRQSSSDWYEWAVYIAEESNVLRKIESVDYLLHHTYPNPLRHIDDPTTRFACKSAGHGKSSIFITIHFKNGTELKKVYNLDLTKPWQNSALSL